MTSLYSRRDFGRVALAALPASTLLGQKVDGVQLGICTYSFRSMPRTGPDSVDDVIRAMKACGGTVCELFAPQLEPQSPLTSAPTGAGQRSSAAADGPSGDPQARAAAQRARQTRPEAKKIRQD